MMQSYKILLDRKG